MSKREELWLLRHAGCRETECVVDQILKITVTGSLKNKEVVFISSVLDEEIKPGDFGVGILPPPASSTLSGGST